MQNRDYYTFIEILMALREQYLKSQELLNAMKRNVKIIADEPFDYNLSLITPTDKRAESEVRLHIDKNYHSGIGPYIRHILSQNPGVLINWNLDHASYLLEYDDKYYFDKVNKNGKYNPKVIIPDYFQDDFANNFQELRSLDLYRLPKSFIPSFNPVSIDGDCIRLTNHDISYDISRIYYMAKDDKIHVFSTAKDKVWGIHYRDLFNSEIPCYKLPNEYLEYLEKVNPKAYNNVEIKIDDYIKKHGEFVIKENEDRIVLTKSLNRK